MLRPGDIVDGRYEVETLLGEGGLSLVWRVRHRELGSTHALKILRVARPMLAERLLIEGRIQAQLRHPHLVAVTDIVHHGGQVGLVLELVEGTSLAEWMAAHSPTDVDTALALLAPVFAGVAAAHQAGVLHRDLKPGNVLLAETPHGLVPKVTDFGIAKVFDGDTAHEGNATLAGTVLGTPGYLAPEQAVDASQVDARADVYALGAMAHELLTGTLPRGVDGQQPWSRLSARPQADVTLPAHIADAIDASTEAAPDARPATVKAFAEVLFATHADALSVAIGGVGHAPPLRLRRAGYAERGTEPSTSPSRETVPRAGYRPTAAGLRAASTQAHDTQAVGGALPRRAETLAQAPSARATSSAPPSKRARRRRMLLAGLGIGALLVVITAAAWSNHGTSEHAPPAPPPIEEARTASPNARALGADLAEPPSRPEVAVGGVWRLSGAIALEVEPPYGDRVHARWVSGDDEIALSGQWDGNAARLVLASRDDSLHIDATLTDGKLRGTTTQHGVAGPSWEAQRGR